MAIKATKTRSAASNSSHQLRRILADALVDRRRAPYPDFLRFDAPSTVESGRESVLLGSRVVVGRVTEDTVRS